MRQKALFYHAGCPVCLDAELRYEVEIVHLGERRERLSEAETLGVKSVRPWSSTDMPCTSTSAPRSPICVEGRP